MFGRKKEESDKKPDIKEEDFEKMQSLMESKKVRKMMIQELCEEAEDVFKTLKKKDLRYRYKSDYAPTFSGIFCGIQRSKYDEAAQRLGFENYIEYKRIFRTLVEKAGWFEGIDLDELDRAKYTLENFRKDLIAPKEFKEFYKAYQKKKGELESIEQMIQDTF